MKLEKIRGLGPKKKKALEKLNIYQVKDLLDHFPIAYENRKDLLEINESYKGQSVKGLFYLQIIQPPVTHYVRAKLNRTTCLASDGNYTVELVFFNQPYIKKKLWPGKSYYFYGELTYQMSRFQLNQPVFSSRLDQTVGSIVPIYSLTEGLYQRDLQSFTRQALSLYRDSIRDTLPKQMIEAQGFYSKELAYQKIHFPEEMVEVAQAQRLFSFERLLVFELALKSFQEKGGEGRKHRRDDRMTAFIESLPFELTGAQARVYQEIENDMTSSKIMNRLVQGDVGSGKTVVALLALLLAYYNGYQSAFMAPTEILATQHYDSLKKSLKATGIEIACLKGSLSPKEKEEIYKQVERGEVDLVIGTHAMIEDKLVFKDLSLVVIDEQHRFGVSQRAKLTNKNKKNAVDTLVMTATPIPRTMVLTFYSDLDLSIIDEMPPGRTPVETLLMDMESEGKIMDFVQQKIAQGQQAYLVCPLIEESDKLVLSSVEEIYERWSQKNSNLKMAMLHGRMTGEEKKAIMDDFQANKISVLFSTTVIEVGVNVPNASLMIIYNAERFGLSQLHQLRGRVGRSNIASTCILLHEAKSQVAFERLKIMETTNDGFEIAKKDLALRGGGDLLGTRQSGQALINWQDYSEKTLYEVIHLSDYILEKNLLDHESFIGLKAAVGEMKDKINERIVLN